MAKNKKHSSNLFSHENSLFYGDIFFATTMGILILVLAMFGVEQIWRFSLASAAFTIFVYIGSIKTLHNFNRKPNLLSLTSFMIAIGSIIMGAMITYGLYSMGHLADKIIAG